MEVLGSIAFDALTPFGEVDLLSIGGVAIPAPRPDFLAIARGHPPRPAPVATRPAPARRGKNRPRNRVSSDDT